MTDAGAGTGAEGKPGKLGIVRLLGLHYYVLDLERSRRFYVDLMGFDEVGKSSPELERAGKYDGNLTRENLRFDSPYNTYRYAGLPPGPIAAPGRSSIEAVLRPAKVDYLYFVSRNDGTHVFATTLAEHNRNVRQWQKRP